VTRHYAALARSVNARPVCQRGGDSATFSGVEDGSPTRSGMGGVVAGAGLTVQRVRTASAAARVVSTRAALTSSLPSTQARAAVSSSPRDC